MRPAQDIGADACRDPRRGYPLPAEAVWVPVMIVGWGPFEACGWRGVPLKAGGIGYVSWGDRSVRQVLQSCASKPLPGVRA